MTVHLLLLGLAFLSFLLAMIGVKAQVNLVALGLACWVLSALLPL